MKQSARKTYRIEVNEEQHIEAIEEMTKRYVADGKSIADAVIDHANNVIKKKPKFTLVTENELIQASKEAGLSTGKSSIVQYRRKGILRDKDGPWFFQNKEHRVVYNLDKMLEFLRSRHNNPKSRIKTNANDNISRPTKKTVRKARVVSRPPAAEQ